MPHDIGRRIDTAAVNRALELRVGIDLTDIALIFLSAHENIHAGEVQTERVCSADRELFFERCDRTGDCRAADADIRAELRRDCRMALHRADRLAADHRDAQILALAGRDIALEQAVMLADMGQDALCLRLVVGEVDLLTEAALVLLDDERPAEQSCRLLCGSGIAAAAGEAGRCGYGIRDRNSGSGELQCSFDLVICKGDGVRAVKEPQTGELHGVCELHILVPEQHKGRLRLPCLTADDRRPLIGGPLGKAESRLLRGFLEHLIQRVKFCGIVEAQELGLRIVTYMRDRVNEFSEKYRHNYSVLATPAEGLAGRFTKFDRKEFGKIEGVTDRDYYTNSNHVPVYYKCSARHKAEVEAPYHNLTRGGHIFYVEIDGDATHNPQVIMNVVDMMDKYDMGYGSVNHNRNRCMDCGYENADPNFVACPKCGSKNVDKLQRITGYLVGTTDRWNKGKLAELNDRVTHVDSGNQLTLFPEDKL